MKDMAEYAQRENEAARRLWSVGEPQQKNYYQPIKPQRVRRVKAILSEEAGKAGFTVAQIMAKNGPNSADARRFQPVRAAIARRAVSEGFSIELVAKVLDRHRTTIMHAMAKEAQ